MFCTANSKYGIKELEGVSKYSSLTKDRYIAELSYEVAI